MKRSILACVIVVLTSLFMAGCWFPGGPGGPGGHGAQSPILNESAS